MTETIEIELDNARSLMHEELVETFGKRTIEDECEQHIARVLTELYDNQDAIEHQQQR